VVAMEGPDPIAGCLLGHSDGGGQCHCPLRPAWDEVQNLLTTRLAETSLRDLQAANGRSDSADGAENAPVAPI
jgi:DNA-binding IscR family transcriptional regulator